MSERETIGDRGVEVRQSCDVNDTESCCVNRQVSCSVQFNDSFYDNTTTEAASGDEVVLISLPFSVQFRSKFCLLKCKKEVSCWWLPVFESLPHVLFDFQPRPAKTAVASKGGGRVNALWQILINLKQSGRCLLQLINVWREWRQEQDERGKSDGWLQDELSFGGSCDAQEWKFPFLKNNEVSPCTAQLLQKLIASYVSWTKVFSWNLGRTVSGSRMACVSYVEVVDRSPKIHRNFAACPRRW